MKDQRGNLFVVVAPSGAGKTSLVDGAPPARVQHPPVDLVHDARPAEGEQDGREYHFVDRAKFEAMIAAGDFLEHANVYGNYYGTSKQWISDQISGDHDVLLEIDWQGRGRSGSSSRTWSGSSSCPPRSASSPAASRPAARTLRGHREAHGERPRRNLPCT
jgi:guanylate kinase